MTSTPWTRVDGVRTAAGVALGCVLWAVGWFGVSGEPAFADQILPMNVAVVGLVVVGVGYSSWFLAGRRAVGARRAAVLALVPDVTAAPAAVVPVEEFLGTERLYHRPGCAMTVERAWDAQPRSVHERTGRTPCGVCRP